MPPSVSPPGDFSANWPAKGGNDLRIPPRWHVDGRFLRPSAAEKMQKTGGVMNRWVCLKMLGIFNIPNEIAI